MGRLWWREDARARLRKQAFGEAVRKVRTERGVSQESLAFNSGLDRTFISAVERGARNPSLVSVYALADALDVEVAVLFGQPTQSSGPSR